MLYAAQEIVMLTTIVLDDGLIADAEKYTGISEKSVLIQMGLEALVQREASLRLARLGGSYPVAWAPRRRRFEPECP